MSQSCNPKDLVASAACVQCLSEKQQLMVQTYLLALLANVPVIPENLLAASSAFQVLSEKQLAMIQASLLCQINGGTPGQ